jgi:DNA replication factor GINS
MMNLDELQSVRDRERQTDKLQQLRESFYTDAGEFIQQLRNDRERAAERADDPFDAPEVSHLSDEIDTAEQTVEAIYEKRVGKIVKAASFAAADLPAESDGMTAEEQALFETLVEDIKSNRQHVMDVLAGSAEDEPEDETAAVGDDSTPVPATDDSQTDPPEPSASTPDTALDAAGVSAADVMGTPEETSPPTDRDKGDAAGPASETESEPEVRNDGGTATAAETDVDRETVRITADVGGFLGVDEREYDLSENDVVTLPTTNVEPLVSRDAAERLD